VLPCCSTLHLVCSALVCIAWFSHHHCGYTCSLFCSSNVHPRLSSAGGFPFELSIRACSSGRRPCLAPRLYNNSWALWIRVVLLGAWRWVNSPIVFPAFFVAVVSHHCHLTVVPSSPRRSFCFSALRPASFDRLHHFFLHLALRLRPICFSLPLLFAIAALLSGWGLAFGAHLCSRSSARGFCMLVFVSSGAGVAFFLISLSLNFPFGLFLRLALVLF